MDIGIGLPTQIPDVEGKTLVDWAARADQAGFSTLGTIGRLVYPGYNDLIALAAAAAVTEQIRLTTSVLLAPLHANAALLAKQAASLDRLSGGRLVLGVSIGGRDDDYAASGLPTTGRRRRLAAQIEEMKRIWGGEQRGMAGAIGPAPAREGGPPVIVGAINPANFRRVAGVADGWIFGGGPPEIFAKAGSAVDQAWREAGRPGKPRKLALAYFGLGPGAQEEAALSIKSYYAWLGAFADQIAAGAATSPEMVKARVAGFEDSGCDELIFIPGSSRPDQVTLLAEAIG
jgi:alkanesulfonate monooxygenase SsuD/methylene tetrahydromethanopterin reductase-like flavin-dependent oxidoreductase (luciferase family)